MKRKLWPRGGSALLVATLAAAAFAASPPVPAAALAHAAGAALDVPMAAAGEPWPHPSEMRFESITFDPVEPARFELSNGIVVYFLENRDLPVVSGRIFLPLGRLAEAPGQAGLVDFATWLIASGGAGELSPEETSRELNFMASEVSIASTTTYTYAQFKSLSRFTGRTLEITADRIMRPRFSPEHVEGIRGRLIEGIRRQYEVPLNRAELLFTHLLAPDHPIGRPVTESAIRSFSREDAAEFHERYFGPEGAVIAVTGDIELATLQSELERTIGTWRPAEAQRPAPPELKPVQEPKIYHVQQQTEQSYIVIGYPGVKLGDPERPAIELANQVLGGSDLDTRLTRALRVRGLASTTYSRLRGGYLIPGYFFAIAVAPASTTGRVIETMRAELRRLIDEPIPPAEIEQGRTSVLSNALFQIDTPLDVVTMRALAELHGLDRDYFEQYVGRLQTLTAEDVQAAVKRWLDPDRMITLVIGDSAAFDRPLSDFGEVEEVEFEI